MITIINIKQLELINKNAPTIPISRYTSNQNFFLFLENHLSELFKEKGHSFDTSEKQDIPKNYSHSVSIFIDDNFFGELYFLINDYTQEFTCFFYNKDFNHKYFVVENETLEDISTKNYFFFLNAIFKFHSLYKENKSKKELG